MKAIRDEFRKCSTQAGLKATVLEQSSGVVIRLSSASSSLDLLSAYVPQYGHDGLIHVDAWCGGEQSDLARFFRVDWYRCWITLRNGRLVLECDERQNGEGYHFVLEVSAQGCKGNGNWPFTYDSSVQTIADVANSIKPVAMPSGRRPLVVFVSSPLATGEDRLNRTRVLEVIGSRSPTVVASSLDDLSQFDPNLAFDKIRSADAFVLVVASRLTTQTLREWAWAKVCDKPTLPLIHANISTDASIAQAFIVPYAIQKFNDQNLKESVNQWLDICLSHPQRRDQQSADSQPPHLFSETRISKIRVLFLSANPARTTSLKLDEEVREIEAKIRSSEYRDSLELITKWAVRPDDLLQSLNQHKPHIVHFSGHGSSKEEILLLDRQGAPKVVSKDALISLFRTLKDNIRVVLLNACFSRPQAEAITEQIDCAIGMNSAIGDEAAITFAASFYRAIGFGRSVKEAFDQGKTSLLLEGVREDQAPDLLTGQGVEAESIVLIKSR